MKVGFLLLSPSAQPAPSTRVAVLNVLPLLAALGVDAEIVFEPAQATEQPQLPEALCASIAGRGFDVVVFQKIHGPSVLALAWQLRGCGVRTVYLVCDLVHAAMAQATDTTAVVTDYLRSLYPTELRHKVHVVHDGIEQPERHKQAGSPHAGSWLRPLQGVVVTSAALQSLPQIVSPPHWLRVTVAGRYAPRGHWVERLRQARWAFALCAGWRQRLSYAAFLADPGIRREAWHPVRVYEQMAQADIGLIPIDVPTQGTAATDPAAAWKVKSENRLTLKMAMGLPVVATPIPAYEPLIEQGVNGFLARSRADWQRCLLALRDPALRQDMGRRARASVLERFSMQHQAARLAAVLRSAMEAGTEQAPVQAGETREDG